MAVNPSRLRADDLPHIVVDDPRISGYELVDGALVPVSPASFDHSTLIIRIASLLDAWVRPRRLGRVASDPWVRLQLTSDPQRVRAPDIAYVSRERIRQPGSRSAGGILRVVPDLAVEVVSTNQRKPGDFQRRISDYVDAGVPLLWVIDAAARTATVYRADRSVKPVRETESLDGEDILPGFVLPLVDVFEVLDEL